MVLCKRCNLELPIDAFYYHKRDKLYYKICKKCYNAARAARLRLKRGVVLHGPTTDGLHRATD
jgi:hypothetical protein